MVDNLGDAEPSAYTQIAIDSALPGFGSAFLAIALFFFCFMTVMSNYYKAETNLAFLNRNRGTKMVWPKHVLKVVLLAMVLYGSVQTGEMAWALGDLGMGTMAWLNFVAILLLTKPALKVLKDYEKQKKEGKDPVFNPADIGLEDADFWENEFLGPETDKKQSISS
nr:alanine:cation symporter family protein [Terrihalobacillus insolitus]